MIWDTIFTFLTYILVVSLYYREIILEFFILRKIKNKKLKNYSRKVFVFRVFKMFLLLGILLLPQETHPYIISTLVLNEFIISKLYHKFLDEVD